MSFAVAQYQTSRIETSSPVQVVVALYDGALRFLRTGAVALEGGDLGAKGVALSKAHAIITELLVTLDHEGAPDLSGQLEAIYSFVLDRIVKANSECDVVMIEEAVRALLPLRDAWVQLARAGRR
jgi:flagellar secretion chaperone FliS